MIKIAYHPNYHHPVPENHRFPMEKYSALPKLLIDKKIFGYDHFFEPNKLEEGVYCEGHSIEYIQKISQGRLTAKEMRAIGFAYSLELMEREMTIASGTLVAALHALEENTAAFNIAGGTHHAFTNKGEGFCIINDQAVAANYMINHGYINAAAIIDLDVHQGNGTAEIFKNNKLVYTFSMHGEQNYPFRKENSDLDIPLKTGTTDHEYIELLSAHLPQILDKHKPQIVFYQAGVDVLASDKLGHLNLSIEGCKQRDKIVFEACKTRNLPIVTCMGGGYSEALDIILTAHINTFKTAKKYYS